MSYLIAFLALVCLGIWWIKEGTCLIDNEQITDTIGFDTPAQQELHSLEVLTHEMEKEDTAFRVAYDALRWVQAELRVGLRPDLVNKLECVLDYMSSHNTTARQRFVTAQGQLSVHPDHPLTFSEIEQTQASAQPADTPQQNTGPATHIGGGKRIF